LERSASDRSEQKNQVTDDAPALSTPLAFAESESFAPGSDEPSDHRDAGDRRSFWPYFVWFDLTARRCIGLVIQNRPARLLTTTTGPMP
jgi:hypothetical protein